MSGNPNAKMFPPIRKNGKGTRRIWKSALVLITVVFHLFVFSVCLIPSFLYFSGLSFSVSGTHGRRCSHPTTPDFMFGPSHIERHFGTNSDFLGKK